MITSRNVLNLTRAVVVNAELMGNVFNIKTHSMQTALGVGEVRDVGKEWRGTQSCGSSELY